MSVKNFIPAIWTARLLQPLDKALVYGQTGVVNRDYEGEIANMGDRVKISTLGDVTITTYTRNSDISSPEELDSAQQELIIDTGKYFNFAVDDVDALQSKPAFMSTALERAGYNLADTADQYLAALLAANIPSASTLGSTSSPKTDLGTAGVAYNYLVTLGQYLDENNVPRTGRWAIVPPWFDAQMRKHGETFVHATAAADTLIRNGVMGMAAGFMLLMSNNVPNTTNAKYKIIAGHPMACSYAQQLIKVEGYRPELRFADAVKGLHIYGGKVVRPTALAMLIANKPS